MSLNGLRRKCIRACCLATGLARAVGTEEPKQFSLLHFEGDMIDSQQLPIMLGQVINFYGKGVV